MRRVLFLFRFLRKRLGGFLESVAATVELQLVAVMHEPIENRRAHRVVAQIRAPILYYAI